MNAKEITSASVRTDNQSKTYGPKVYKMGGDTYRIEATVRYDDRCKNGHNTFSVTGTIEFRRASGLWDDYTGGCIHDDIIKHFPELAPFIKWHLCSSDGPLHYIANTIYHAGDRDCNGLRKGEFRQHTSRGPHQADGVEGVPNWVLRFPDGLKTDVYSHEKPQPVTLKWEPYGRMGKGKPRNFDAARASAIWPEATAADLSQEPEALKYALLARLPALLTEFRSAIESLGFVW